MKCPKCVELGEKSKVFDEGTRTTLLYYCPFYDEDGVRHVHDANKRTTVYKCSNGHTWEEIKNYKPCPTCNLDWVKLL